MCCWHVATNTHTHRHTPVQNPTNQNGFQDWLHYLTCDHAQIHLESFSPHCCRCLDWSTCSKPVSGYLRHSVLKSLFRVSWMHLLYKVHQRANEVGSCDCSVRLPFWWHPPYLIDCFRPWQRQAEVQRAVASEAQWIRIMGQLTVWLLSFVCISWF